MKKIIWAVVPGEAIGMVVGILIGSGVGLVGGIVVRLQDLL